MGCYNKSGLFYNYSKHRWQFMIYDVFISYSTLDKKIAEGICGYLESNGYRCFVAYRDIPKGKVWAAAIPDAIDESKMMVAVFSKNFDISTQTDRELELVAKRKMPILTYRIADDKFTGTKEYYLSNLNWIDAFPNPKEYFQRLLEDIQKLIGPTSYHKEKVAPPPQPKPTPIYKKMLMWIKSVFKGNTKLFKRIGIFIVAIILVIISVLVVINLINSSKDTNTSTTITSSDNIKEQELTTGIQTFTVDGVEFNMVFVEGGTFTMGATEDQGSEVESNELPTHQVTLSDYYIGETEVTQALWKAVMGKNPSYSKGENLPVERVSYNDVKEFITKLNQKTGKTFRLPTEAEWEYAARGGKKSRGYTYSGDDDIDKIAWVTNNSDNKTHPVKTKQPNELGIYDMSGNVCEWCFDWYEAYTSNAQTNPQGPSSGSDRVYRGGSSFIGATLCRVSIRYNFPSISSEGIGFRLALSK